MDPVTCTNCGLTNFEGEKMCRRCGADLVSSTRIPQFGISPPPPFENGTAGYSAPPPSPAFPQVPEYGLPRTAPGYPGAMPGQGGGVWRDGDVLVMHKAALLPDYCIKCATPANGSRLRRKLNWHHPALALLVLLGCLGMVVYLIIALVIRKSATVDISLCPYHIRRHRIALLTSWLMFATALAFLILALAMESGGSALFGAILLLASAVSASTWARVIRVKKIDDSYVWLKGIAEGVLAMLPAVRAT